MIKENTPMLITERLVLRKADISDSKDMYKLLRDSATNEFLPWFPVKDIEETERFIIEKFTAFYTLESAYRYVICLRDDCKPVGYIWIADNDSNDLGYALRKDLWHKGIVTEAARAVARRVSDAGAEYITATHDVKNPYSGAVMKNIGMEYKYTYKERVRPKNILVDFRMYQLNFDGNKTRIYEAYREKHGNYYIETGV